MNRMELKTSLEKEQIDPRFYPIHGLTKPPIAEQGVLGKEGDKWLAYCSERREKTSLRVFESEDEACRCFLVGMEIWFS